MRRMSEELRDGEVKMPTLLWIFIGVIVLVACCGAKKQSGQKKVLRVNHLHYFDLNEYECSVCGARFRKNSIVCPKCGAQFQATKEDSTEFDEEMMEEEDWDEEHGM